MLSSLRDGAGNTTIDGLDSDQAWTGVDYPADQFRTDANVLDGVDLIGDGTVAEMVWGRPAVTVLGIDIPRVVGSASVVQASTAARISLRVPPGMNGQAAQDALIAHLENRVPWNLRCRIEPAAVGDPFVGSLQGAGFDALQLALEEAFGQPLSSTGAGGSIPLCNVFAETFPAAEIFLMGVEEPRCLIHAPNESVDPTEIERVALAEALFLDNYSRVRV